MVDKRQQELISASIDGELTAQEQAAVDQLLASNPEAATLHEELRALSNTLQAMPQRRVGEDLSAKILRQAQQEKQVTPAAALSDAAGSNGSAISSNAAPKSEAASGIRWRRYTWSAMAVAAALLIMVVQSWNEPTEMSPVAMSPKESVREPAPSVMSAASSEEAEVAAVSDRAALQEAPAGGRPADAPVADSRFEKSEQAFGASKGAFARSAQRKDRTMKKGGGGSGNSQTESIGTGIAAKSGRRGNFNGLKQQATSRVLENKDADQNLNRLRGAVLKQLAQAAGEVNPEGVLVVQVDISPEAAKGRAFDRLLASNKIVFVEERLAEAKKPSAEPAAEPPASTPAKPSGKNVPKPADPQRHDPKPQDPQRRTVTQAQTEATVDGMELGKANAAPQDMVYVVASYQQIQQTLASLGAEREQYLSVEVNPAPEAAAQRPLAAYTRNAPARNAETRANEGSPLPGQVAGATQVTEPSPSAKPLVAAPLSANTADKVSENKPSGRDKQKPTAPRAAPPLNSKVPEKSKAVSQDAESLKSDQRPHSGYAQRIQAPGVNALRKRSSATGRQGVTESQQLTTEPANNRSPSAVQPTAEANSSDSVQGDAQPDTKLAASPHQELRVLFVLRVVDPPGIEANEAPPAKPAF